MKIDKITTVCVVGFKKSGISLCRLFLSLGKKVKVSEISPHKCIYPTYKLIIDQFKKRGVEFEFGAHTKNFLKGVDLIVLSPGVDTANSYICKTAKELNILTVGELEVASWFNKAKILQLSLLQESLLFESGDVKGRLVGLTKPKLLLLPVLMGKAPQLFLFTLFLRKRG